MLAMPPETSKSCAAFPGRLRLAAAGYTVRDLADAVGVTANSVRNWRAGRNDPPAGIVERLADYLNVSSDYLLGLSKEGGPDE